MSGVVDSSACSAFLAGGGATGAKMRAYDWSASPLGHPDRWPQSLRTAVGMVLNSSFPGCLVWGPDLVTFYNDAFRPILGAKPEALGRPFDAIWSEAWETLGPIAARAFSGEPTFVEDFPVTIERNGYPEEAFFTFCYSPVRDESGKVAGFLDTVIETTGQVLQRRRQTFRLEIEERLRGLDEPRAVMAAAAEILGRHLGAERVGFCEVQADDDTLVCETCFADRVRPLVGPVSLRRFGRDSIARQRRGHTVACDDVATDPTQDQATWKDLDTRAFVSVPLVRDGRFLATLFVNYRDARRWTPEEVMLVEDVAARTWSAVERARAESALESLASQLAGERARLGTLVENLPVGVALVDAGGCTLLSNPAFRRYRPDGSLPSAAGESRDVWIAYDEAGRRLPKSEFPGARALRGETVRGIEFLHRSPSGTENWVRVSAAPLLESDGQVGSVLTAIVDIDEIKRSEEHQRLLTNELNHRVKNTLATVQSIAFQTLRNAGTAAEARHAFEGRLLALSRAHDVLTRENWEGAELREIAAQAVEPYGAGHRERIRLEGPRVRLSPRMALSLAMVLQELATNAAKYGALSNATGEIAVTWSVDGAAPARLRLQWRESGGPTVAAPVRRGFGTRLIERSLAQELDGTVTIGFVPTGVVCEVDAPLG